MSFILNPAQKHLLWKARQVTCISYLINEIWQLQSWELRSSTHK